MPSVFLLRRTPFALQQARKALFDEAPAWDCVGCCERMHEGLLQIEALRPDVVVSDLRLLDGHLATLLQRLEGAPPRLLALSSVADDSLLFEALCAGAQGYWLDRSGARGLGQALQDCYQGRAAMLPALARQVLARFGLARSELQLAHCVGSAHDLTPAAPGCPLSKAEQHLLSLIAQGLLDHEIAQRWQLGAEEVGRRLAGVYTALQRQHRTGPGLRPPAVPCR